MPALVGLPAGIEVFTSKIYLAVNQYLSFGLASSLAVTILFFSTLGVYLYSRATSKVQKFATITGKGFRPRLIDLGRLKYVTCFGVSFFFLVTIGLPVFVLLWSFFRLITKFLLSRDYLNFPSRTISLYLTFPRP